MSAVGLVTFLGAASFALGIVLLVVEFATKSELADRLSGAAFLGFEVLLIPAIFDVHRRYVDESALTWLGSAVGLIALAVLIVSGLLVLLGRVTFPQVALLQTGAFVGFIAWMAIVSVLILSLGGLPTALGWLGIAAVVVGLAVILAMTRDRALVRGEREPTRPEQLAGTVPCLALVAWLMWLAVSL